MVADAAEDFDPAVGIDLREEGVGRLHIGMDTGHVYAVGPRDHLPVHHAAADDEDFSGTGRRGQRFVRRGEELGAGRLVGFGQRLVGHHHIAATGQAALAERTPGAQPHDDRMAHCRTFEVLEIRADVPRDEAAIADRVVFGGCADQAEGVFHTATGALMAGQGS